MTEKWKAAFKQIYGTTPTKSDYKMAPDHIKADDQYSPLKRPQWKKSRTETSMIYFRSPRKQNVSTLLLPTPEKPKGEPMEPFKSEECNSPKRGKASKNTISSDQKSSNAKKQDGNFVRINMKKKSFVRGKLSAEQKRKIRRKQNWKKRFGSKTKNLLKYPLRQGGHRGMTVKSVGREDTPKQYPTKAAQ
uniref:Uncharacterized protein n=1 Tax=Heterorhabditis bacteriophora TaxID=37862 RepID=A0A1I7XNJ2_HETBA